MVGEERQAPVLMINGPNIHANSIEVNLDIATDRTSSSDYYSLRHHKFCRLQDVDMA